MQAAKVTEIKKALNDLDHDDIMQVCLRLAKFKKENKELLTYLLFESIDEQSYIDMVVEEMHEDMRTLNKSSLYLAKKTVRKVLRGVQRHIRYSDKKTTQIDLLIAFCKLLKSTGLPLYAGSVVGNIFQRQLIAINKSVASLHEDLQHDYLDEIEALS